MNQNEVVFFNGEFVSAQDYADEQMSQFSQRWSLASGLFGTGILDGLVPSLTSNGGSVAVTPGQAMDPVGRLLRLDQVVTLALPSPVAGQDVFVLTARYTREDVASQASAVGRFAATTTIQWDEEAFRFDETSNDVELARWSATAATTLDLSGRRYTTTRQGSVSLYPHGAADPVTISAWGAGQSQGYAIDADRIALTSGPDQHATDTTLSIGASAGIGTMNPQATVDVVSATSMTEGLGTVTSDGKFLYFSLASAQAMLAPDFTIMVKNAQGREVTGRLVQRIQGGWQVDTDLDVSDVGYWFQRPLAMRLGNDKNPYAMSIDRAGNLGIGTKLPSAKLEVRDGLTLAEDSSAFLMGGTLSVITGGAERIDLIVGGSSADCKIDLTAPAGLALSVAAPGASSNPALQIAATGEVGIGVGMPNYMLDIEGLLQSSEGGFVFPDGSVQTSAQESVPIGTIIDFWQGATKIAIPPNFRICDGSVIAGAGNYMDGKTTPDLKHMFVQGTTDITKTGVLDDSNASHDHAYTVPQHVHPYPHGHPSVSGSTGSAGSTDGMWGAPNNNAAAHHTHNFTLNFSALSSSIDSGANSDANGRAVTDTTDTTPPFFSLLKLVRVS